MVDPSSLNDVAPGTNRQIRQPAYLCTGEPGYDGPTGLGTPNGVGAFGYRAPGEIAGVVTDATRPASSTAQEAMVTVPGRSATTNQSGRSGPGAARPGANTWTISDYGYQSVTAESGTVGGRAAPHNHDVALGSLPRAADR